MKTPRVRNRPPFFAIALLVAFTGLVLGVITVRQIRSSETRRLRLLAGFAERIESTAEDYTEHLSEILATLQPARTDREAALDDIYERLEALDRVYVDVKDLPSEAPRGPRFSIDAGGDKGFVTYRGTIPAQLPRDRGRTLDEQAPAEGASVETTTRPSPESPGIATGAGQPWQITLALDLRPALSRIRLSNLFDSVLIAGLDGRVLVQQGEPELRTATLLPLLESARRGDTREPGNGAPADAGRPPLEPLPAALSATTQSLEVTLAGRRYRLFLQPITIELPRLKDDATPRSVHWVACGVVSRDRLLTGSTTSPLLLAVLFAIFPLGLILWPFLKLLLTSSRQPFTRFDSASLVLSTLLGVALLTLLLLGLSFAFKLQKVRDDQLAQLSHVVERSFWEEIADALTTLGAMNESWSSGTGPAQRPGLRHITDRWTWDALCAGDATASDGDAGTVAAERRPSRPCPADAVGYPEFASVFWVDDDGDQLGKIARDRSGANANLVANRGYFQCIREGSSPEPGVALLERFPDLPWAKSESGLPRFCIQSLLSKTSREPLAAIAIEGLPDQGLPVAAMTTPLWSLTWPALAPGFQIAVLDERGRVMFHSDRSRNLVENFFKAADEDRLLRSVMRARRSGHLSFSYWGRSQRAYVEPLEGSPWTLVVFRDLRGLRLRVLETLYDFLHPFLLYTVLLSLIGFVVLAVVPGRLLDPIWPDGSFLVPYEVLTLFSVLLLGTFGLILALADPVWVFFSAALLPLLLLGGGGLALHFAASPASRWRDPAATDRWWHSGRGVLATTATGLAVVALLCLPLPRVPQLQAVALALTAIVLALARNPPTSLARLDGIAPETAARPLRIGAALARRLHRARWLERYGIFLALVPLLLWLYVIRQRIRESPAIPIVTFLVLVAVVLWICTRHQFVPADVRQGGKKRRFAYLWMLTAVLAVTAIVPILGFFEIARSRQLELLILEQQIGLVDRLESRTRFAMWFSQPFFEAPPDGSQAVVASGAAATERGLTPLCDRPSATVPRRYEGVQGEYLAVFFSSACRSARAARRGNDDGAVCSAAVQPSWSHAGHRTRSHLAQSTELPTSTPGQALRLIARLLSSRPVPVSDPSIQQLGVDLSRFDSEQVISSRRGSLLATAVRTGHGAGEIVHLGSCLDPAAPDCCVPPRSASVAVMEPRPDEPGGRWGAPQLCLLCLLFLTLPAVPLGLAYLISHEVLLVTLVRPERTDDDQEKAHSESGERTETDEPQEPPRTVGELTKRVKRELRNQPFHAATVARILERVEKTRSGRPQRVLLVTGVPDLALEPVRKQVADAEPGREPFEIVEFSDLLEPSSLRRPARSSETRAPVILTHFRPEIVHEARAKAQLKVLQRILEQEKRAVVLVCQAEAVGVLGDTRTEEPSEPGSLRRRWEGFLASFTVEYGRDDVSRYPTLLPRVLYKLGKVVGDEAALQPILGRRNGREPDDPAGLDLASVRRYLRHDLSEILEGRGKLTPEQRHQIALLTLIYRECSPTRHLQGIGNQLVDDVDDPSLTRDRLISRIGYLARPYYQAIWASLGTDARVILHHMAVHGMANPKAFDQVLDLLQRGIVVRDPALRPMNASFTRFVRQAAGRSRVLSWEAESGTSAWSVLKWLLPLPLLLLGGFLYVTQRDSFSSIIGFLVALGSIAPILTNLYSYFEQAAARRVQQRSETPSEP